MESSKTIRIGGRLIGSNCPAYIVAEAGSNHNGSLPQAFALIEAAKTAGADAIKFQNFRAEKLYPRTAGTSDYLKTSKPIYDIIKEMEMPEHWVPLLAKASREAGLDFISSPFDERSADIIAPHVDVFKIASYELTHTPLLRHVAGFRKPVFLSTGTSTVEEVGEAVQVLRKAGAEDIVVLQCTASYPTPPESANLRAMCHLRDHTGCPAGLSDHTREPALAPVIAVALGACVIEKHFTFSNRLPGPDHRFAIECHELAELVRSVRTAEAMLGDGVKRVLDIEQELRGFARRSIFAVQSINPGETLTPSNIAVLRCGKLGFGLNPEQYDALLGRKARRRIGPDTLISLDDLD